MPCHCVILIMAGMSQIIVLTPFLFNCVLDHIICIVHMKGINWGKHGFWSIYYFIPSEICKINLQICKSSAEFKI